MGSAYNPQIVTNGLVMYLDAANPKSYPGSGTTWSDLSGNGNNGTLTNGPTYNSGNNGSIVFDGVDDYSLHSTTGLSVSSSKSVMCWVYPSATRNPDYSRIVNHMPDSTNRFVLTLNRFGSMTSSQFSIGGTPNNNGNYGTTTSIFTINNWYYLGWVFNGSTFLAYCNGIEYPINDSTIGTFGFTGVSGLVIGARTDTVYNLSGKLSNVQIYNRALSASEIQQNFNATRGRYGI